MFDFGLFVCLLFTTCPCSNFSKKKKHSDCHVNDIVLCSICCSFTETFKRIPLLDDGLQCILTMLHCLKRNKIDTHFSGTLKHVTVEYGVQSIYYSLKASRKRIPSHKGLWVEMFLVYFNNVTLFKISRIFVYYWSVVY